VPGAAFNRCNCADVSKPDLLFNDVGVKGVGELELVGVAAAIAKPSSTPPDMRSDRQAVATRLNGFGPFRGFRAW
jgi:hypothetical protein